MSTAADHNRDPLIADSCFGKRGLRRAAHAGEPDPGTLELGKEFVDRSNRSPRRTNQLVDLRLVDHALFLAAARQHRVGANGYDIEGLRLVDRCRHAVDPPVHSYRELAWHDQHAGPLGALQADAFRHLVQGSILTGQGQGLFRYIAPEDFTAG